VDKVPKYSRLRIIRFCLKQSVITQLHTNFKVPVSRFVWLLGKIFKIIGRNEESLSLLLKSRRIAKLSGADHEIRQIIRREVLGGTSEHLSSLLNSVAGRNATDLAGRILILKIPTLVHGGVVEKGAIIIKFSETLGAIYQLVNVSFLSKYFRIILEPSWVGYSIPQILIWTKLGSEKVVVFSPYDDDFSFISALGMNLVPTTLGPADWANPDRFKKLKVNKKEYDCICIANFDPMKRVDRYLRAVVRVTRRYKDFKAALVCANHGSVRTEILDTVRWAQSKANIDFFHGMSQIELNKLVNKAKVNVLVSLREGANKGLAEGLLAGIPALLVQECACGNQRHINDMTGKVVPDNSIEEELLWFSENYTQFDPRTWAEKNISPQTSTKRLSDLLRKIEITEGRVWIKDLYVKINTPELAYLDNSLDYLLSKRKQLLDEFSRGSSSSNAAVDSFLNTLHES